MGNCEWWQLDCQAAETVTDAVASSFGQWLTDLAGSVVEAVGQVVAALGTWWVDVPTPRLTASILTTSSTTVDATAIGPVAFIQSHTSWWVGFLAVLSIILAGGRMAWTQRAQPAQDMLRGLFTLALVSGAGLVAIDLAVFAADEFSRWIIDESVSCPDGLGAGETCFGRNVSMALGAAAMPAPGGANVVGQFVILIGAIIALLASIIQVVMMMGRGAMLVLLAGVFPLTASATSTEWGQQWFKKSIGWLVAFILYKPVAAIIYATAFQMTGAGVGDGVSQAIIQILTGLMMMVMALFAMPALMRFVAPAVGAVAGGAGAGMMAASAVAAGASAAGQMPTGAKDVGGGGRSSSSSSHRSTSSSTSSGGKSDDAPTGAGMGAKNATGKQPTGAAPTGGGGAGAGTSGAGAGATATGAGAGATGAGAGGAAAGAGAAGSAAAGAATGGATIAAQAAVGAVQQGIQTVSAGANQAASQDDGAPSGSGR